MAAYFKRYKKFGSAFRQCKRLIHQRFPPTLSPREFEISIYPRMTRRMPIRALAWIAFLALAASVSLADNAAPLERCAFIGRKDFSDFAKKPGTNAE